MIWPMTFIGQAVSEEMFEIVDDDDDEDDGELVYYKLTL